MATCSVLRQQGLQAPANFVNKVVQLHETLGVRFGAMVVGPTGTAKSSLLRTLQVTTSLFCLLCACCNNLCCLSLYGSSILASLNVHLTQSLSKAWLLLI